MENIKELLSRIESLEEENRILKSILAESSRLDIQNLYQGSTITGAVPGISVQASANHDESSFHDITQALMPAMDLFRDEQYIRSFSRKLNALTDERSVLKTVLQELLLKSGSKNLYYIQLDELNCIITSLHASDALRENDIFSFQAHSSPRSDLALNLSELYEKGSMILKKTPSSGFFVNNLWLKETVDTIILRPVIMQSEIPGIIIIDITGHENEIRAADMMIYQIVSGIAAGSLKKIAYEKRICEMKERCDLIIENTTHLLFQSLPDGTVTFANRRFSGFFNSDPADLKGKSLTEIIGDRASRSFSDLIKTLPQISGSFQSEIYLHDFKKNIRIIKLFVNPVMSESGDLHLVNFLGEDITEKKHLEDELRRTKKRLDLAFLASNDAYWDANLITGEFFYSQNFYRMLDYDSADMPSNFRDFLKLVHPDDIPMIESRVKDCLDGKIIRTSLRFRAMTGNGSCKWIFSRAMIIEVNENGAPSRVIGTNVDLTQMVRIEEKLKESETRLKLILDNMPVMLDAIDESGCIIHWNRECEHVSGYTKEEILNNPDAGLLLYPDAKNRKFFYSMLEEHSGNYRNMEFTLTCKSGVKKNVFWSNLSDLYPVPGWHSWAVGIDITPLKETTEALNKSTYKLKEAQSIARLGYWEYDHRKSHFIWDSTLSRLIGYELDSMIITEDEILNYIHEDDRNRVKKSFFKSIKDMDIHNEIIRYITGNGDTIHIKQSSKTDYDTAGNPVITRGICFDITELKKTELELVKAKEKAEENNRLKSAFLANMSHEVRTPLNSIMGFSELLSDRDISSDDKIIYTDIIRESSKQLSGLISDIIDLSKIDAGLIVINKKTVRLNRVMDHIYEVFRNQIRNRDMSLVLSKGLDDNTDIVVTDETRLQQILNNLLVNALKFTASGSIEFGYSLTEDRKFLQFYVTDTGIGIQKNKQKMIFGRFKQADSSIGRKYGGTGLGLSISRELCKLLGGKIWVRSELKKGSTFFFKIPYSTTGAEQFINEEARLKNEELISRLLNKKILIVDDNRSVHKLLSAVFKKYSVTSISAETGSEAIDILKKDTGIDAVLLDIQMPDMDGTVVIKLIKEIHPGMPVIAQTANALEDDRKRYLALGFDGYVAKPYNREELIKTVSSLIINT